MKNPSNAVKQRCNRMVAGDSGLAGAAVAGVLNVDVDGILEIAAELLRLLLSESVASDDCKNLLSVTVLTRWD